MHAAHVPVWPLDVSRDYGRVRQATGSHGGGARRASWARAAVGRRAHGKAHGSHESFVSALPLYLLYDRGGHFGGVSRRLWVGVEAAETAVSRAEAARVIGMRAVLVCHGLGWPRGGITGRGGGVRARVSFCVFF